MSIITFDTYQSFQNLKDAGFEEKLAKALTQEIQSVHASQKEGLATKEDVTFLKGEITLLKWMVGFCISLNLVTLGVVLSSVL